MNSFWEPCCCGKAWAFTACLLNDGRECPDGFYCKELVSACMGMEREKWEK